MPSFHLTRLHACVQVLQNVSESQYLKIHSRDMVDPLRPNESPRLVRLGLNVEDSGSNSWLSEDSFPLWKDSEGLSLISKLDLSSILLPQTKGNLSLMRWVMARLALEDFCEAAELVRRSANELLTKLK